MDEIKASIGFSIFVYIVTVLFIIVVKSMGYCSLELWECFVCSIPVLVITFFMCWFFEWV